MEATHHHRSKSRDLGKNLVSHEVTKPLDRAYVDLDAEFIFEGSTQGRDIERMGLRRSRAESPYHCQGSRRLARRCRKLERFSRGARPTPPRGRRRAQQPSNPAATSRETPVSSLQCTGAPCVQLSASEPLYEHWVAQRRRMERVQRMRSFDNYTTACSRVAQFEGECARQLSPP